VNLSSQDLAALTKPVLVFAAIAVLSVLAIVYSGKAVKKAASELSAAEGQLAEARERVQRSGEEYDNIIRFTQPYRELQRRGLVGEEQRLNWVDGLRNANADAQLYGVEWELGPQQPYAFTGDVNAGSLQIQQTLMKMRFGLLYEEDVGRFFRLLAAQNVGSFAVNSCSLQRAFTEPFQPSNQPMLKAECELAWITIPLPAAPEGGS
jgi:hypothetical protein